MTNNETKKALECCVRLRCHKCDRDTLFKIKTDCRNNLMENTLDLINRLEAEVERLEVENKHYAELEQGCYVTGVKNIKTEAVKEFVEKAKEELAEWIGADNSITYSRIEKVLDNL